MDTDEQTKEGIFSPENPAAENCLQSSDISNQPRQDKWAWIVWVEKRWTEPKTSNREMLNPGKKVGGQQE